MSLRRHATKLYAGYEMTTMSWSVRVDSVNSKRHIARSADKDAEQNKQPTTGTNQHAQRLLENKEKTQALDQILSLWRDCHQRMAHSW